MVYRTPKHVQEQKDAKYRHILDIALRLFAEKGYNNTSIQDISSAAGVSVGSLYFYFPNKKSIYEALYADITRDYLKSIEESIRGETDLRQMILKSIRMAVKSLVANVHVTNFFLTNSHMADLKMKRNDWLNDMVDYTKRYYDEAVRNGQLKPLNTELAAATVVYSIYYLLRYLSVYKTEFNEEEVVNFLFSYTVRGLGLDLP